MSNHEPPASASAPSRGGESAADPSLTAFGSLVGGLSRWARDRAVREPTDDEIEAVDDLIPDGEDLRPYVWRFGWLTVMSASIAAFGLIDDSAAVVIGAMLVAPLMTPITAAAAALVAARNGRLWRALAIIGLGTLLAILVGWVVSWIAGRSIVDTGQLPGEIRSRTFPGLLDLGIAVAAGAAAGYILPRRSATSALPGVGIAVALVPPLATVGITLELGLGTESRNALLLYLTNLAAIVFSASVALLLSGFRPYQFVSRRTMPVRLLVTVVAVVAVAIPLYFHTTSTLDDLRLRRAVVDAVTVWDPDVGIVDVDADVVGGRATVDVLVLGRGDPRPAWELANQIRERFEAEVDLELRYQRDELFVVSLR